MGHVQYPFVTKEGMHQLYMENRKEVREQYRKCQYCDSWYDKALLECPKCGAPADLGDDKNA